MKFSKLYITAIIFGLIGAATGAFAGGFMAAAACDGGLECLGVVFIGVGLEGILVESGLMSLAVHRANQKRGSLLLTFLPTLTLAVPIPFALFLGNAAPLAILLFLFQAWACVKVQITTGGKKMAARKARQRAR